MLMLTAVAMPFALMLLMLAMERVEEPLRVDEVGEDIQDYLLASKSVGAAAGDELPVDGGLSADDVEIVVREGYGPALKRYWRRRRVLALLRREG